MTGWGIEGQRASLIKSLTGAIQALGTIAAPTTTHTRTHAQEHTEASARSKHKAILHTIITLLFLLLPLFQLSRPVLALADLIVHPRIKTHSSESGCRHKNKKINGVLGRAACTHQLLVFATLICRGLGAKVSQMGPGFMIIH